MNLIDALRTLDSETDEHWIEGQPSLDYLSEMVGSSVTAEDLAALDMDLTRPAPGAQLDLPASSSEQDETTSEGDDEVVTDTVTVNEADIVEVKFDGTDPDPLTAAKQIEQDRLKEMQDLQSRTDDLDEEITQVESELAKLTGRKAELSDARDQLIREAEESSIPGHVRTQLELKLLRERTHRDAMERHERRQAALELVNPKDLDPRTPLDRSMARRKGRGMNRPKRSRIK